MNMLNLLGAAALLSLASTAAYADSESYPTPINRPIMSTMPGADVGPNGSGFTSGTRVQMNNGGVVASSSSESGVTSTAQFPNAANRRSMVAAKARNANHS